MNFRYESRSKGFTIIELMIVLIILAVLVALAYPSYVNYIRKAKRGEAEQLLMNWSINQEIWRSNNALYAPAGSLPPPVHDDYTFSTVGTPTATTFALQAVAKDGNDQLNDQTRDGTNCSTLNINSAGQKYSGGDTSLTTCWD